MKRIFCLIIWVALVSFLVIQPSVSFADDTSEAILKVLVKKGVISQGEVDEMKAEIAKSKPKEETASKDIASFEEKFKKEILSKVGMDKSTSRLKIKGRWAAGFFDSEKAGTFPNGSIQAPEAKIQFAFAPDDINNIIMRLNLNNATFNNLDYFYLDTNLMKLTPWEKEPFTLVSRIGRFKIDFGEETFSNNAVESILPSNSASNVAGNDEGLQLSGKIGKDRPLGWSATVSNGNSGTGADNNWLKAFNAKLYYNIIDPLYVSASYYNSGNLDTASSEMSIAGITAPPTNTLKWSRQIAEIDARYDFKKGKTLNPPAYCDSLAYIKGAYGYFYDNARALSNRPNVSAREGSYGFVEGLYNVTKKIYAAGRASIIGLSGQDNTASLNSITTNSYQRYSIGLGYRLTNATLLKGSYDFNLEKNGTGGEDPKDNLLSVLISSQF